MSVTEAPQVAASTDESPFDGAKGFFAIAAVLVIIATAATTTFGLPGLAMTALALVPVMYVILILLSVGK